MNVTDINAKKPPVTYTVHINHFWGGAIEYVIEDVALAGSERGRRSVASALRACADALEYGEDGPPDEQKVRELEAWAIGPETPPCVASSIRELAAIARRKVK